MALTRVSGNLIASGVSLTFDAGNAAFPALTTTGDTNTGIFFPAADTIAFTEGGAESMRIDSSGNLGVGTTSPFNANGKNIEVANSTVARIVLNQTGTRKMSIGVGSNVLNIYDETADAERMRLDSGGNLGIGTSSPTNRLSVVTASGSDGFISVKSPLTETAGVVIDGGTSSNKGAVLKFSKDATVKWQMGTDSAIIGSTSDDFHLYGGGANAMLFSTNATERARITSTGLMGLGVTPTGSWSLQIYGLGSTSSSVARIRLQNSATGATDSDGGSFQMEGVDMVFLNSENGVCKWEINGSERARITAAGDLLIGKTVNTLATAGVALNVGGNLYSTFTRNGGGIVDFNRTGDDGDLIAFYQDGTKEGSISVSGTTVSYNGGHLSRWAQTTTAKDDSLLKGTVLSNLDEMNVYTKDGQPVENEQLNKVKVSDTEGDVNVAGVFVNWSHDEDHNVDEINMAMTGDMIIRIAQGVTVVRGDLLMSAGDGTAKPQGDDIIRSKTVAKVTSNHVTCTYADGSYCVPCVLMAC